MPRTDELRLALKALGVTTPPALMSPSYDKRTRVRTTLSLANALLGTAEREIVRAEMDLGYTSLPQDEIDAVVRASERSVDAAAGWAEESAEGQHAVLHWRTTRLHRALAQRLESAETDPALAAACDAAALTAVLLGYCEARELQFIDTEHAEGWRGMPETSLHDAIALQERISDVLSGLSA
ncbi:hypothetical protein FHX42_001306 [Saccharopolyspora lacisalsi]|uniref:Uncharacterized protein n=1 Tax=Halosaccharopolyspora lacisalsi TaxID=1000566 RepID=A0A839DX05_9PSEU|nr:DUF6245 family protein [Halosaccharopolyspora lacisalsi]MBA8823977.1 hypothetical protein [Halosaccharopolyspora lacisalsi]